MRNSDPLIVISPAVPAALDEPEGRRDLGRSVARMFGTGLVLLALGAACVLILEGIGL
ncbi:MAG: hypothetical protein Q7J47_04505 [Azoarcus sp.]|nr:hypothetical protein [Azoarcus sp.]